MKFLKNDFEESNSDERDDAVEYSNYIATKEESDWRYEFDQAEDRWLKE